jgi:hypothetical protein
VRLWLVVTTSRFSSDPLVSVAAERQFWQPNGEDHVGTLRFMEICIEDFGWAN